MMMRRCFRPMVLLGAGVMLGLMSASLPAVEKAELRGVGQFEIPAWFKSSFLDLPEDVAEAARGGKRLMLYFGQEGCPYCAELFNKNFSQAHIVEYTRRHFDAIDLNMWGDREVTDFSGNVLPEKELAAKLKVWFTPTLLFFNEKGEQVLRINGYYPPHQFLAALQYVAEKQENRVTFREYLAKQAPPPAKGALHSQPFFAKPPHDLTRCRQGSNTDRGHVQRVSRPVGAGLRRLRRVPETAEPATLHPRTRRPSARAGRGGGYLEII